MIYIGELWRYLETQPPREDEQNHTLRVIIGNGLRPETWKNIVSRFNIRLVVEHYGSTEMPGDAILNYFNKIGSCGFVPPSVWKEREAKLIAYDVETESVMRNEVCLFFCLLFFLFFVVKLIKYSNRMDFVLNANQMYLEKSFSNYQMESMMDMWERKKLKKNFIKMFFKLETLGGAQEIF